MNTKDTSDKTEVRGPVFVKMGIPDALRGKPCNTIHDPEKVEELGGLLKTVSAKRQEESNEG